MTPLAYELRPARPEDAPLLCELYRTSRLDEVRAWGWPEEQVTAFLRMQWETERQARPLQFPQASHDIIVADGREVGRIMVDRDEERILLVDVALLPEARGRGIGTQLLQALLDESERTRQPIMLTVDLGSRAEGLYQRHGFVVVEETTLYRQMIARPRAASAAVG